MKRLIFLVLFLAILGGAGYALVRFRIVKVPWLAAKTPKSGAKQTAKNASKQQTSATKLAEADDADAAVSTDAPARTEAPAAASPASTTPRKTDAKRNPEHFSTPTHIDSKASVDHSLR